MFRRPYLYIVILAWLAGSVLAGCKPSAAVQQVNALNEQSGEFHPPAGGVTSTAAPTATPDGVQTQPPTEQPRTAAPTAVQGGGQSAEGLAITRTPILAPPAATLAPLTTGTPIVPASGPSAPQIISFTASPAEVKPGGTVTLSWQAVGANALLSVTYPTGMTNYQSIPLSGTQTITVPSNERYSISFSLEVSGDDAAAAHIREFAGVTILCTDTWFFDGGPDPNSLCPLPQESSDATMQQFEHGFMMWIKAINAIYAFVDGSSYYNQANQWEPSMPESDPTITPPAGFYQPVRGFGLAWRNWTGSVGDAVLPLRDIVGWATAPEAAFGVVYQCSAGIHPRTGKIPVCFYRGPNGRVIGAYFGGMWKIVGQ